MVKIHNECRRWNQKRCDITTTYVRRMSSSDESEREDSEEEEEEEEEYGYKQSKKYNKRRRGHDNFPECFYSSSEDEKSVKNEKDCARRLYHILKKIDSPGDFACGGDFPKALPGL